MGLSDLHHDRNLIWMPRYTRTEMDLEIDEQEWLALKEKIKNLRIANKEYRDPIYYYTGVDAKGSCLHTFDELVAIMVKNFEEEITWSVWTEDLLLEFSGACRAPDQHI